MGKQSQVNCERQTIRIDFITLQGEPKHTEEYILQNDNWNQKGVEYAPTRRFPTVLDSGSSSTVSGTRLSGHGITHRSASPMHHIIANKGSLSQD